MPDTANVTTIEEARLEQLGLIRQPFAEAGFFYTDESIETRLNLALHLMQGTGRLVLIAGPPGIGRSTFLRQLAIRGGDIVSTGITGGAGTNMASLLSGLGAEGPTGVLERLRESRARHALLIDDADRVPQPILEALVHCHEAVTLEGVEWPILLVCEEGSLPEMERVLVAYGYDEDLSQTLHLPPFDEDQTDGYLRERLAAAGDVQGTALSDHQIERIHQRSGGIPARIHRESAQALAGHRRADVLGMLPMLPPALRSRSAWLVVGLVVLSLAVALPLTAWLTREPPGRDSMPLALAPERGSVDEGPGTAVVDETLRRDAEFSGAGEQDAGSPPPPVVAYPPTTDGSTPNGAGVIERDDRPAPAQDDPESERASAAAEGEAAETESDTADPPPVNVTPEQADSDRETTVPEQEPDAPAGGEENAGAADPDAATASAAPAPSVAEEAEPAAEPPTAAAPALEPNENSRWLDSRNPEHYVLQLIGGRERDTVERFFAEVGRDERMRVVESRRDGAEWLVVVTGDYPSVEEARDALGELPEDWQQYGAFPRSFGSLQR